MSKDVCPTCGEPWTFQLCARCTPEDDSAARLAQEVEFLKAEKAVLESQVAKLRERIATLTNAVAGKERR